MSAFDGVLLTMGMVVASGVALPPPPAGEVPHRIRKVAPSDLAFFADPANSALVAELKRTIPAGVRANERCVVYFIAEFTKSDEQQVPGLPIQHDETPAPKQPVGSFVLWDQVRPFGRSVFVHYYPLPSAASETTYMNKGQPVHVTFEEISLLPTDSYVQAHFNDFVTGSDQAPAKKIASKTIVPPSQHGEFPLPVLNLYYRIKANSFLPAGLVTPQSLKIDCFDDYDTAKKCVCVGSSASAAWRDIAQGAPVSVTNSSRKRIKWLRR